MDECLSICSFPWYLLGDDLVALYMFKREREKERDCFTREEEATLLHPQSTQYIQSEASWHFSVLHSPGAWGLITLTPVQKGP